MLGDLGFLCSETASGSFFAWRILYSVCDSAIQEHTNTQRDWTQVLSQVKSKFLLFSGIQSIQQESHMKIHNLALTKHLQSKQFQLEIVSTISEY